MTANNWKDWKTCRIEFAETAKKPSVVEPGIKPLVDAINKHPYLVSISSCEGHEERGEEYQHAMVNFLIKEGYASKVVPKLKQITKDKLVAFQKVYEEEKHWKPYLCPSSEKYMTIRIPNPVKKKMIPLLAKEIEKLQDNE